MEDKFKIIITDNNGQISVDVITKDEWFVVKETDIPKSNGLPFFSLCKLIVSSLKKRLQESK